MLSRGMDCRLLTTAGEFVQYDNGGQSTVPMHRRADGAAVIAHPDDDGWYYTSNSQKIAVVAAGWARCVSMRKGK